MPVPVPPSTPLPLFPPLTRAQVDGARTSAWHELFHDVTADAHIIDLQELGERDAFLEWIESDSIFLPEGSEATTAAPHPDAPVYRLPKLNAAIRAAVAEFGAVFPKLNWTAPRDAAFLLPQGHGPLYCASPADVYLLLKSSDFAAHGLDSSRAYEGCTDEPEAGAEAATTTPSVPKLELVLKKYIANMNPSREFRVFVRDNVLLGITQRDMNFYEHLQSDEARERVVSTIRAFWEDEVRDHYEGGRDYVLDLYLGETSPSIIDFAPYRDSTDGLLFTYDELRDILQKSREPADASETAPERLPILRVIDSAGHPAVSRPAPTFSTNMMPLEMLQMSEGRTLAELAAAWDEAMNRTGGQDSDSDDDE